MKGKDTCKLMQELKNSKQIEKFMSDNEQELQVPALHKHLNSLLQKKAYFKADFIKKSGLDRSYAYHILAGHKQPSRDKLIIMALTLELSLLEVQQLLKYAGFRELYVRDKRDGLIIYAINNKLTVLRTNELLHDFSKDILK